MSDEPASASAGAPASAPTPISSAQPPSTRFERVPEPVVIPTQPSSHPSALPAQPLAARPAPPKPYSFQSLPPRTASLRRRGAAFLLDYTVLGIVIITLTVGAAIVKLLQEPGVTSPAQLAQALLPVLLLAIPLFLLYFTVFEGLWGRTLGKAALGLRVETAEGGAPGLYASFVRNLLRLLWGPAIPSVFLLVFGNLLLLALGKEPVLDALALVALAFLLVDVWLIQTGEMEQRLGDLAAGTIVVQN